MQEIRKGSSVIDAQIQAYFESDGGCIDSFYKFLGDFTACVNKKKNLLKATWITTALGPMVAIADEEALYLLEFVTRRGLVREVERLCARGFAIIPGVTTPLESIEKELQSYFEGKLTQFKTPYRVFGSPFQQQVWQALCEIPYGETHSYAEQAVALSKPTAYRAVANANGANQLAIIIPCHRIIASDGTLGGYGGGLAVKQGLLDHEQRYKIDIYLTNKNGYLK